jgi:hypothetical protein
MRNAAYNLKKLLLSKLDVSWRVREHYLKDADAHSCDRCKDLLSRIMKIEEDHAEKLRAEIAKHIRENTIE